MAPTYFSRMAKKKKTVIIDDDDDDDGDYEVGLNLTIHHADDIENSTTHPNVNRRLYGVVGWVTPEGYEFFTQEAEGLPNPVWNLRYQIALGRPMEGRFLNLEVVRIGSKTDPGTSTGLVLVGRTRIPLPKELPTKKGSRHGLVRLDGQGYKAEGNISITMQVKKLDYDYYY
ncbi:hypothetical protein L1049_010844 [Liquidambar formosana]|uniref:C2 domain-containing protein n=1 Tax=Liquidambar formosana TaxID=63359 RepID=A0AAP0X1Z1_LIQFO